MLDGFKGKTVDQMRKIIENDLTQRKRRKGKTKEEEAEERAEDKRRRFLEQMRPPYIWNFFDQGNNTPHILRAEADPFKCYVDGRIQSLFEDINALGIHLTKNDDVRWKLLVKYNVEIFKAEYKKEQEDAANEAAAQQVPPAKK